MREMLLWQTWHELAVIQSVDSLKFLTLSEQFCKFVSNIFNLAQGLFLVLPGSQYDDNDMVILRADSIMGVCEVATKLVGVGTARWMGTRIRPRKQTDVEARLVGAIDNRSFPSKPVEKLLAVSALGRISLQLKTLVPGPITSKTVTERCPQGEKLDVQKTPFPAASQLHETTWPSEATFTVRKTHDSRTGVIG